MEVTIVIAIVCLVLYGLWSWLGKHGLRKFVVVLLLGWFGRSYIKEFLGPLKEITPYLADFVATTPGRLAIIACLLLLLRAVSKFFRNLIREFTNSKYGFAMFIIVVLIYLQKEYDSVETLFNLMDDKIAGHWEFVLGGIGAIIFIRLIYKIIKGILSKKGTQRALGEMLWFYFR